MVPIVLKMFDKIIGATIQLHNNILYHEKGIMGKISHCYTKININGGYIILSLMVYIYLKDLKMRYKYV